MQRVRAIIVDEGRIALIERHRDGRRYFVFPGGGVEAGESPRDALVRELREETGLEVDVGRLVVTVTFPDHVQGFCLASIAGGAFGTGDGPEYVDERWAGRGTYCPVWLPVADLASEPVYPRDVATLVLDSENLGWPDGPLSLRDRIET